MHSQCFAHLYTLFVVPPYRVCDKCFRHVCRTLDVFLLIYTSECACASSAPARVCASVCVQPRRATAVVYMRAYTVAVHWRVCALARVCMQCRAPPAMIMEEYADVAAHGLENMQTWLQREREGEWVYCFRGSSTSSARLCGGPPSRGAGWMRKQAVHPLSGPKGLWRILQPKSRGRLRTPTGTTPEMRSTEFKVQNTATTCRREEAWA